MAKWAGEVGWRSGLAKWADKLGWNSGLSVFQAGREVLIGPQNRIDYPLYQRGDGLSLAFPGGPPVKLIPVKGLQFKTPQFSDTIYEFVMENGQVKALKERDPSGEYSFSRQ